MASPQTPITEIPLVGIPGARILAARTLAEESRPRWITTEDRLRARILFALAEFQDDEGRPLIAGRQRQHIADDIIADLRRGNFWPREHGFSHDDLIFNFRQKFDEFCTYLRNEGLIVDERVLLKSACIAPQFFSQNSITLFGNLFFRRFKLQGKQRRGLYYRLRNVGLKISKQAVLDASLQRPELFLLNPATSERHYLLWQEVREAADVKFQKTEKVNSSALTRGDGNYLFRLAAAQLVETELVETELVEMELRETLRKTMSELSYKPLSVVHRFARTVLKLDTATANKIQRQINNSKKPVLEGKVDYRITREDLAVLQMRFCHAVDEVSAYAYRRIKGRYKAKTPPSVVHILMPDFDRANEALRKRLYACLCNLPRMRYKQKATTLAA